MKVYDGEDKILGRLASKVADELMEGEEIRVVNAEKIIITGKKENILENYREKRRRGKQMGGGPFFPQRPERIFKRTVRGMLPYQKSTGRKAFKRLRAYIGIPPELEDRCDDIDVKESKGRLGLSLREVSEDLGTEF